MERTEHLGVRVPPDVKEALARAAKTEDRSLASLVEKALREWLVAGGHMPGNAPSAKRPKTSPTT